MAAGGLIRLTGEQQAAVDNDGNLLLTACPGSGKTRTLIAKLVAEIEEVRGSPRTICCITYTNTAVQEIEQRTREQLQPGDEGYFVISTIHAFCLNEILRPYGRPPLPDRARLRLQRSLRGHEAPAQGPSFDLLPLEEGSARSGGGVEVLTSLAYLQTRGPCVLRC